LKCLELIAGLPHIPSRLAVRKVGLKPEFSLVTREAAPKDAAVIGNFKPRLLKPDDEFWISVPRSDGKLDLLAITGRQCCEAFFREIGKLLKAQGRKPEQETIIRLSEPPFASAAERKTYQETVRTAAKEAGLGTVAFFREPDATFEYFRLLHQEVPAQGKALNFLVLDFGGGTCNVSVVSTTRQGNLWQRYIAAPVAAEAPSAGGLYIDQEILTQALVAANIKHHLAGRQTEERRAYEAWLERHMGEAEHLKQQVSETGLAHQLPVRLDGRLAELSGGERTLDIHLDPERLRGIVEKHWSGRGIRDAVDSVLLKLHNKLKLTAQRKDVADDPRALVTQVLIAGGSSQLPGFVDHVKKYFGPHTPKFTRVGQDYAYSVAVGMGLNFLAMDHALLDERPAVALPPSNAKATDKAPEPAKATDSTFMAAFPDDLCLFWVPPKDVEPQLLYPEETSPFDLLEMPHVKILDLPGRSGGGFRKNKFQAQSLGYQVAYRGDEEARVDLSSRRLNIGQHQIQVPVDDKRNVSLKTFMQGEPGRFLELILEVFQPGGTILDRQSIPFLTQKPTAPVKAPAARPATATPKAPPVEVSGPMGRLLAQRRDALCIDFGTTNTTLIDLGSDSEISVGQFLNSVRPVTLVSSRATPLHTPRVVPFAPEPAPMAAAASGPAPSSPPAAVGVRHAEAARAQLPLEAIIAKDEVTSAPSTQQFAEQLRNVPGARSDMPPEVSRLNAAMPRKRPERSGQPFKGTELEFLQHLEKTCNAAHFEFPRELLETLYLSLKVRPFVVLAGPSGVGKSALAQLMAEACGGALDSKDLLRIAVEAHWTDSRFIFGRRDAQGFRPTDFYRLLRQAQPDRLYHVLLDEMNLAHVEYYFAQLLSAMEGDGVLSVPEDEEGSEPLRLPIAGSQVPLLRFYGTINVDESTQVLSDKVLDRVNVIEVESQPPKAIISAEVQRERGQPRFHLTVEQLQEWHRLPEKELKVPDVIQEIWALMAQREPNAAEPARGAPRFRQPLPIGQRVIRDIALFVHYAERLEGTLKRQDAIDLQVKQRILPKIRGDLRLQDLLEELADVLEKHKLERSAKRLKWMRQQLEFDQFVTFWA
jgi:energy-coupling factor transporter ATP-binding protein EcfA2